MVVPGRLWAILSAAVLVGCAGADRSSKREILPYMRVAEELLGGGVVYTADSSGRFVMCLRRDAEEASASALRFHVIVIEVRTNQVVLDEAAPDGSAVWLDDLRIQVNTFPVTVRGDKGNRPPPAGYVYDVQARSRVLQIPVPPH